MSPIFGVHRRRRHLGPYLSRRRPGRRRRLGWRYKIVHPLVQHRARCPRQQILNAYTRARSKEFFATFLKIDEIQFRYPRGNPVSSAKKWTASGAKFSRWRKRTPSPTSSSKRAAKARPTASLIRLPSTSASISASKQNSGWNKWACPLPPHARQPARSDESPPRLRRFFELSQALRHELDPLERRHRALCSHPPIPITCAASSPPSNFMTAPTGM